LLDAFLGRCPRLLHFAPFGAFSDDQIGISMMRLRHTIPLILAVLFAALVANSISAQDYPRGAQQLKFGFTPVLSEPEMRTEFEPLMNYLSDAIGQKVTLYIAKDYGDPRTQMENGSVDIGSFSPFAYVDAAGGGKIRHRPRFAI
jgi:ABC-type phosphate/phosphonate transport system substrate-binding protein